MTFELTVRVGSWAELGEAAYAIRKQVFVEEQGVPLDMEHDEHDAVAVHVLASTEGTYIGTGRLLPDGHIGRVAVLPAWRGRGAGARLMRVLITTARQQGHAALVLHAQSHAIPFYRALGFEERGTPFIEAGLPHQKMFLVCTPLPDIP